MLSASLAVLITIISVSLGSDHYVLINTGGILQIRNIGESAIIPNQNNFTLRLYRSNDCPTGDDFEFCYEASLDEREANNNDCARFLSHDHVDFTIVSDGTIICNGHPSAINAGKFVTDTVGAVNIKVLEIESKCPVAIFGAILREDPTPPSTTIGEENVLENSISLWWIAIFLFLGAILFVAIGFGIWGIRLFIQHQAENKSHHTPPSVATKPARSAMPTDMAPNGVGPEDTLMPPNLETTPRKQKSRQHKDAKNKHKVNKSSESREISDVPQSTLKMQPSSIAPSSANLPSKGKKSAPNAKT